MNEDFVIHLNFVNDYDDVKVYRPFSAAIDDKLEQTKKQKKKKWGDKLSKKPEVLTAYSMNLIKSSPENVLEKLGENPLGIEPLESENRLFGITQMGVRLESKPAYIVGKYNKYSRNLPQTPWHVDGVEIVRRNNET